MTTLCECVVAIDNRKGDGSTDIQTDFNPIELSQSIKYRGLSFSWTLLGQSRSLSKLLYS
eukprot:6457062-Amphidinium_carterae.1